MKEFIFLISLRLVRRAPRAQPHNRWNGVKCQPLCSQGTEMELSFPAICQGRSERKEVMKTANLLFLGNQASPNIDFLKAKGTLLSGKYP